MTPAPTMGFSDALILMRSGRVVRPVGWRSHIKLAPDGKSFRRVSETGAETAFTPSAELILATSWEPA